MEIKLQEILVKDLVEGYINDDVENGVIGYGGKLNIRPKYQREFVYKDEKRDKVIDTVNKNFPLNVMYWALNDDGTYEVLDGQQRTISICDYIVGKYSINERYFHNLEEDEQTKILNYKLMIYICKGEASEKLAWFETINIAGEKLTDQELLNAVYTGTWLSDAKRYFSKNGCAAYKIGSDYVKGTPNRQEYLETAIKWISNNQIKKYMSENQHNPTAIELWNYFNSVINWIEATFTIKRKKEMFGLEWGFLYNEFKDKILDPKKLEQEISKLMEDEDVTNKKGIYHFVLTRNEKNLSLRSFSDNQKREAYERQKGICPKCTPPNNHYKIEEMQGDHIIPWSKGGKTIADHCQMLCSKCNREKSNI
ncbi:GmrSD restriction endonuclease domain-containing protein [Aliarcobacter cryaerophilus]|uniref:GmrSD restriction endonuclease domain-containing protein n=1 Tax=Aliarcobacter cryaerophilus TaxID=28198 RepID=UPI001654A495|nr:DUF262 domain-containing protein [Aliarcobacter cryaerophilus]QNM91569.1 DUF262 domain-containing protein [Aliarcobacter cryaerophilus]